MTVRRRSRASLCRPSTLRRAAAAWLAFASDRDGNSNIYTMNVDGSGRKKIVDGPSGKGDPAWSPDSSRIALRYDRRGSRDIYKMNVDGSNLVRLVTRASSAFFPPSWSPAKRIRDER